MHTYYTVTLSTWHVCDVIYNTRSAVCNLISTHKLLSVIRGIGTVIKIIQVLKPVWVVEHNSEKGAYTIITHPLKPS